MGSRSYVTARTPHWDLDMQCQDLAQRAGTPYRSEDLGSQGGSQIPNPPMVILWVPYKLHYGVAILGVPGNCHWWPRGVPYL